MHRVISLMLILSLVATIVVPVWASQPAPQRHTASVDVKLEADDGLGDILRKGVKYVAQGCAVWSGAVLASGGSLCMNGVGAWICGSCAVFTIVVAVHNAATK
jgi:hypothetical protein